MSATDLSGAVLDDRYQVIEPIAEGAMGAVYRGERLKLGRAVAIKIMHDALPDELASRQRFEREAKLMARLEHPHCVSVIDFGLHDAKPYLVMELVRGTSLLDELVRIKRFQPARAAELVRQVLSGLAHAHELGIVHRDIKPANIMITERTGLGEQVRILDFGLARPATDSTKLTTGIVVGTPNYMAPEQIKGQAIDARTDLYAVGVLLFELLTGTKPFLADDPLAVVRKHLNQAPPTLADVAPGIPFGDLEEVVGRALMKAPAHRFASAAEMSAAIDQAIGKRASTAELMARSVPQRAPTTPSGRFESSSAVKVATESGWNVVPEVSASQVVDSQSQSMFGDPASASPIAAAAMANSAPTSAAGGRPIDSRPGHPLDARANLGMPTIDPNIAVPVTGQPVDSRPNLGVQPNLGAPVDSRPNAGVPEQRPNLGVPTTGLDTRPNVGVPGQHVDTRPNVGVPGQQAIGSQPNVDSRPNVGAPGQRVDSQSNLGVPTTGPDSQPNLGVPGQHVDARPNVGAPGQRVDSRPNVGVPGQQAIGSQPNVDSRPNVGAPGQRVDSQSNLGVPTTGLDSQPNLGVPGQHVDARPNVGAPGQHVDARPNVGAPGQPVDTRPNVSVSGQHVDARPNVGVPGQAIDSRPNVGVPGQAQPNAVDSRPASVAMRSSADSLAPTDLALGTVDMFGGVPAPIEIPPTRRRTVPPTRINHDVPSTRMLPIPGLPLTRTHLLIGGGVLVLAIIAIIAAKSGGAAKHAPVAAVGSAAIVVDAHPTDPVAPSLARASDLYANGDLEPALDVVTKARRQHPESAQLAFLDGKIYFAKLWWTDGVKAFRDAIRLDGAYRNDPELLKIVLRGFLTTPDIDPRIEEFIREELGEVAKPGLAETAKDHPNASMRSRAAAELRRLENTK